LGAASLWQGEGILPKPEEPEFPPPATPAFPVFAPEKQRVKINNINISYRSGIRIVMRKIVSFCWCVSCSNPSGKTFFFPEKFQQEIFSLKKCQ
jgi:hypothetical protein